MMTANKSSENVANLTYLGPAEEFNCTDGEIKSGLNSGTRWNYSVQNLLSAVWKHKY
jgi:hypothetical protein